MSDKHGTRRFIVRRRLALSIAICASGGKSSTRPWGGWIGQQVGLESAACSRSPHLLRIPTRVYGTALGLSLSVEQKINHPSDDSKRNPMYHLADGIENRVPGSFGLGSAQELGRDRCPRGTRQTQRGSGVIEQRVQQVLEIETQATGVYEAALRHAGELEDQAANEAQVIVKQARAEAQVQAQKTVADAEAQAQKESKRVLTQADVEAERMEAMAMGRFGRAVTFVLNRVAGTG